MKLGPLFLGIVIFPVAVLLFMAWPAAKPDAGSGTKDAKSGGGQAGAANLPGSGPQTELVEAEAILRIEKSSNVTAEELTAALGTLLERPQLDEISARLALKKTWSMDADQIARHLGQVLHVSPDANADDGIIRASDPSPKLAAEFANTAAGVLRDHLEHSTQETVRLDKQIVEQRDVMEDKRKTVASIIRTGMIIYTRNQEGLADKPSKAPEHPEAIPEPEKGAIYLDAKRDFEKATQELERLEDQRREVKEIKIHHILWAETKPRE